MAFFRNSTVNLLNLHYGVHALAISGGGAFFAERVVHQSNRAVAWGAERAAVTGARSNPGHTA